MKKLLTVVSILLLTALTNNKVFATFGAGATYYIGTTGSDSTGDGSYGTPYHTSSAAMTTNGGGNVYIFQPGTYSYILISTIPAGPDSKFTAIKCETLGRCFMTRSGAMNLDDENLANFEIQYMRFDYVSGGKKIVGKNWRVTDNIWKGGAATGNEVTVNIGDGDSVASRGAFERNLIYGAGGRYKLLTYNSNMLTIRNNVARHDDGWTGASDPAAVYTNYESSSVIWANNLVIDSSNTPSTYVGAFYTVDNGAHEVSDIHYIGNIVVITKGIAYRGDANLNCSSCTYRNNVAADARDGGITWNSGTTNATVNGFTLIMASYTDTGGTQLGFYGGGSGTKVVKNGIVTGYDNGDLNTISGTYFDTYDNGSASGGTGVVTYNPRTNGLKYLTRIESGSNLATAGEGGTVMGATIENKFGVPGTLYGQPGYYSDSGQSMWPLANEGHFKACLCENRTDGLCDPARFNISITSYVVGYTAGFSSPYPDSQQGGSEPCDGVSLNPSIGNLTSSGLTASWTDSTANHTVALASDSGFSSILSSASLSGATSSYVNLNSSTEYFFKVKVSSNPDCAYTSTSGTTLANPPTGIPQKLQFKGSINIRGVKF
jgi:hypothetical protein